MVHPGAVAGHYKALDLREVAAYAARMAAAGETEEQR
jgi:hypothetical protein